MAARISDVPASNCRTQFDRPQLHPAIHGNGTSNAHATGNIFLAPHLQNGRRASKDPSEARRLPEGSSMSIDHHRGGCAGGWSALVPLTRCLPSGNAGSCQRKIQSVDRRSALSDTVQGERVAPTRGSRIVETESVTVTYTQATSWVCGLVACFSVFEIPIPNDRGSNPSGCGSAIRGVPYTAARLSVELGVGGKSGCVRLSVSFLPAASHFSLSSPVDASTTSGETEMWVVACFHPSSSSTSFAGFTGGEASSIKITSSSSSSSAFKA